MSRPKPMAKLSILCAKQDAEAVIRALYKHQSVHIMQHEKKQARDLDIGAPLDHSAAVSELLVRTRSLMQVLHIAPHRHKHIHLGINGEKSAGENNHHIHHSVQEEKLIHDVEELYKNHFHSEQVQAKIKELDAMHQDVESLLNRKQAADAEEKSIRKTIAQVAWFSPFYIALDSYKDAADPSSRIVAIAGTIAGTPHTHLDSMQKAIASLGEGNQVELITEPAPVQTKCILIIDRSVEEQVRAILKEHSFVEQQIPLIPGMSGTPELELVALEHQLKQHMREKKKIEHRLYELKHNLETFLLELEDILAQESAQAQAPLLCMESAHVLVISGYVPRERMQSLQAAIKNVTSNSAVMREETIMNPDEVPIALHNAKSVRPFEFLLKLYSLPNYSEFDPSLLLFLTFPLFFGFMLGDIGYGLVSLAMFLILRRRVASLRSLWNIFLTSSFATIAFGFVFGEFFGYESAAGISIPHLVSRSHDLTAMMLIAVIAGALHLMLSFVIGFFNELPERGFVHAFTGKFGWIFLEIGAALLIGSVFSTQTIAATGLSIPQWIAWSVMGLAVAMIGYGEQVRGIVELPSIFSNILSYLRLMAVALASVSLAIVVNELAGGLFSSGIIGIIGGVLILLIGHSVNLVLGLIGPFLHSLRLHYVESFTKFYQGGGKAYHPFGTA